MGHYFFKLILIFATLNFMYCDKNDDTDKMEEVVIMEESRFKTFIGDWVLESIIIDDEVVESHSESMTIEEDGNLSDRYAIGQYTSGENPSQAMTVELGTEEFQIILKRGFLTFDCTYNFPDPDHLELDDSNELSTVKMTYKRKE